MSFLFDLVKSFGFGVMLFILIPIVAAALPWRYARPVTEFYQKLAMALVKRGLFVQQSHGGLRLKKSNYYAQIPTERTKVAGQTKDFKDPGDLMHTLFGRPFGLAHEEWGAIVDARLAYFIRRFRQLNKRGEWERDGKKKAYFAIDPDGPDRTLVNIGDLIPDRAKTASPTIVDRLEEYARKSQLLYNSSTIMQQSKYFIALGVGFGLMWFAKEMGGSAPSTGEVIPIMLSGVVVMPV